MRKSRTQRKSRQVKQLSLFDFNQKAPSPSPIGGTEKGTEPVVELLSRLERQRTLTGQILEQIVDYGNLKRAYEQVRRNGGAAGVDGMEVAGLRSWLGKNINQLRQCLLEECYQTSAVRKVEIPKPNGGVRILGIPTVKDRMVQQAVHQVLAQYYDPHFSESSFGFRPGRNAHQAVQQAAQYINEGREWVVDIDLEKFFDKINHDRLMQRLSKGIGDKRLLRLINAFLKAGLMEGGLVEQRIAGTPQGGPLSPLLSNIVLDELDKELEKRGHKFCRYADDCNIYVSSQKAGERVMASLIKFIEKKLKLKVNRSKSGVRHCTKVKFLGYTILPGGDIRIADKSLERLKDKVRQISRRNRGVEFEQVIKELNAVITGWTNYFRLAEKWLNRLKEIDKWLRRKLRCYRLKQCGRKYTIFKLLYNLGMPEHQSWYVAMRAQGWWDMSNRQAVRIAMSKEWFAHQGLRSLYTELTSKS
jgi:RNA-directed DNA polymerase